MHLFTHDAAVSAPMTLIAAAAQVSQTWPGFNASSISPMSALYMSPGSPLEGCGRCMEIKCAAPVRQDLCIRLGR